MNPCCLAPLSALTYDDCLHLYSLCMGDARRGIKEWSGLVPHIDPKVRQESKVYTLKKARVVRRLERHLFWLEHERQRRTLRVKFNRKWGKGAYARFKKSQQKTKR